MIVIKEKNKGLFKLSTCVTKNPSIMAAFFEHFTPLKFDLDVHTGIYYMLCESELFSEVPDNSPIPFYDCEVRTEPGGKIIVTDINKY